MWRWIEKLRALGVRVKGHPRTGYQIEKVPDILAPKLLHRRLHPGPFGKRIYHFFKIDSTNSVAMTLGERGEPHGTVVIAEEQTAGRGRAGHTWHSEKTNGIYMTVLLRPPISPQQAPLITLVAGLAVRDAIVEQTGLAPDLRWPNDLLFGRKKFCGILTEMNAEQDQIHFVAVGIGINVNHERDSRRVVQDCHIAAHRDQARAIPRGNRRAVAAAPRLLLQSFPDGRAGSDRGAIFRSFELRARKARAHRDCDRNLHGHDRRAGTGWPAARAARRWARLAGDCGNTLPRRIDAADAGCRKHEHGAGIFPRRGTGGALAAHDRARPDRR